MLEASSVDVVGWAPLFCTFRGWWYSTCGSTLTRPDASIRPWLPRNTHVKMPRSKQQSFVRQYAPSHEPHQHDTDSHAVQAQQPAHRLRSKERRSWPRSPARPAIPRPIAHNEVPSGNVEATQPFHCCLRVVDVLVHYVRGATGSRRHAQADLPNSAVGAKDVVQLRRGYLERKVAHVQDAVDFWRQDARAAAQRAFGGRRHGEGVVGGDTAVAGCDRRQRCDRPAGRGRQAWACELPAVCRTHVV